MGRMSREKGKRGERELVTHLINDHIVRAPHPADTTLIAKRNWGEQSERSGSGIDVISEQLLGFAVDWQVKYGRRVDTAVAMQELLDTEGVRMRLAMEPYYIPAVATRKVPVAKGQYGGWIASVPLDVFLALLQAASANRAPQAPPAGR